MFKSTVPILTSTIIAAAAIAEDQLIGFDNQPAAADAPVKGIAHNDAATGEAVSILHIGLRDLVAAGAISSGDLVKSDANGNPITHGGVGASFARALDDAAQGDRIQLLINVT